MAVAHLRRFPVAPSASLAIHVVFIGAAFLMSGETTAAPLKKVIVAELVVRAPKQKEKALPRRIRTTKRRAKRKPKKRKAVVTESDLNLAAKALERTQKEVELDQAQNLADEALARVSTQDQTGDDPSEARAIQGSDQGTRSDGESRTGSRPLAQCTGHQRAPCAIPDTDSSSGIFPKVDILRIGPDGTPEVKLVKPSGHAFSTGTCWLWLDWCAFPNP